MRQAAFFVVLALFIAPLSGCTNPQGDFDAAFSLAQDSFSVGDFEMAEAHLADALEAVPDSSAGLTLKRRINDAVFSQEVLVEVESQAESSDWSLMLATALQLNSLHPDHEAVVSIASMNFALNMTNLLSDADGSPELNILDLESMLIQGGDAQDWGLSVPEEILDASTALVLEQRGQQLRQLVVNSGAEAALTLLEELLVTEFYDAENFGLEIAEISDSYASEVVEESRALTRGKDLSGAVRLVALADKRLKNNEAIEAERARVAQLVTDKAEADRKAEEAAKQKALKAMRVNEDSFEGIKWYYDRATYSSYSGNKFLLYIGKRDSGAPWLRLQFMMLDSNWHFFERIVVDVDGTKYRFSPGYFEVNRDNGSQNVWEWYDFTPSKANLVMVDKIIDSKSSRIRYINDDNFYEERTITSAQKRALSRVLLAFESLGGRR